MGAKCVAGFVDRACHGEDDGVVEFVELFSAHVGYFSGIYEELGVCCRFRVDHRLECEVASGGPCASPQTNGATRSFGVPRPHARDR